MAKLNPLAKSGEVDRDMLCKLLLDIFLRFGNDIEDMSVFQSLNDHLYESTFYFFRK